uniref:CXXC-type domain-containing protein n=1 Tax=Parastrongyloides trichosuri TaxID=131310 RepID=A0A0N4Z229_PARTI
MSNMMTTSNSINAYNSSSNNNNSSGNIGSKINNSRNNTEKNTSGRNSTNSSPTSNNNINHGYSSIQQSSVITTSIASHISNGYPLSLSTYPNSNNYQQQLPPHMNHQVGLIPYPGVQTNNHVSMPTTFRASQTSSSNTGNGNNNTTTTTTTAMNRSQRCGICRGCQCKPCGHCTYCQDSPQFGGPGVKKQSCIERRCLRVLENRLQRDSPTFKARLGCNNCDDCRLADCQVCLVCLDKRFFDNRYMTGALCAKKRCNNATSIELPCQVGNQERNLKRGLDHNGNGYDVGGKRRNNGNNNNNYNTNQQMPIIQQTIPHNGMNLLMPINGVQQLPPTTISCTTTPGPSNIPNDSNVHVSNKHNIISNYQPIHDENSMKKGNQMTINQPYTYSQIPQQPFNDSYLSQINHVTYTSSQPSKYHMYPTSNMYPQHNGSLQQYNYPTSTTPSYPVTTSTTPMNGSPPNGSSYSNANFYEYDNTLILYPNTIHSSTSDPYLPPSYTPELKNNVVIQQL